MPLLLWSTNTWLKHRIQKQFCGDVHYVWCSPCFESSAQPRYALGASLPPSSDPATIYKALKKAIAGNDGHDPKVADQKKTLGALAEIWRSSGSLTEAQRDEIVAMVSAATILDWRPLVFVIPYAPVAGRVQEVPRPKRASQEMEYIVPDLRGDEFEIIEP